MLDNVTLDQLKMLIAVADEGSFSAAARRVRRVQSAVSHAMANLEETLGLVLWDRTTRLPTLTEHGRAVLSQARKICHDDDLLRSAAERLAGGQEAVLGLCLDQLFPTAALVALCREFAGQFPTVDLRVRVEMLSAVAAAVRSGESQLGVCAPSVDLAGLVSHHATTVRLVTVCGKAHPLAAQRGRIATEALREHVQVVVSERGPGSAPDAPDHAVLSTRTWRVADLTTKHELLRNGLGWGNLPEHLVRKDLARGRLVRIRPAAWDARGMHIALAAIHRPDQPLGPAGRWVMARLGTLCKRAMALEPGARASSSSASAAAEPS
ncbi:MAG: LysR family transcriptional regulator [Myxococcota bacterium]